MASSKLFQSKREQRRMAVAPDRGWVYMGYVTPTREIWAKIALWPAGQQERKPEEVSLQMFARGKRSSNDEEGERDKEL